MTALESLKLANAQRRKHRRRAARAHAHYVASVAAYIARIDEHEPFARSATDVRLALAHLELMRTSEASRGSRINARRAHEAWEMARLDARVPAYVQSGPGSMAAAFALLDDHSAVALTDDSGKPRMWILR